MDDAIDEMLAAARAIDLYELKDLRPEMKEIVATHRGSRRGDGRGGAAAPEHRRATAPGCIS